LSQKKKKKRKEKDQIKPVTAISERETQGDTKGKG
jgi:hypothetical protein